LILAVDNNKTAPMAVMPEEVISSSLGGKEGRGGKRRRQFIFREGQEFAGRGQG